MQHSAIRYYQYQNWANKRIFQHLNSLPDEVYNQQIKSVFSSVQEVLIHIYQTDGMWLSVMSGDQFSKTMEVIQQLKENIGDGDLQHMSGLYQEMEESYQSFLSEQEDLDALITIEHPKYGKMETPLSALVKHVVNHGTYHRGNITAMLRQQGHTGVPTDFIFFLFDKAKEE